jgi:hypothetical protein
MCSLVLNHYTTALEVCKIVLDSDPTQCAKILLVNGFFASVAQR